MRKFNGDCLLQVRKAQSHHITNSDTLLSSTRSATMASAKCVWRSNLMMNGYTEGDVKDNTKRDRNKNGDVLTLLNIEDLSPFFQNPVKWCDPNKLMRFKDLIEKGVQFPPITVCLENERLVVYDGHHRWFAAYLAGQKQIQAWVTK